MTPFPEPQKGVDRCDTGFDWYFARAIRYGPDRVESALPFQLSLISF